MMSQCELNATLAGSLAGAGAAPSGHAPLLILCSCGCCARQVKADKQREVKAGHDGSWVAHPALVSVAMAEYNEFMPQCNQLFRYGLLPVPDLLQDRKSTCMAYEASACLVFVFGAHAGCSATN